MSNFQSKRRKARHYAMQALYQWQMAGANLSDIEAEFLADYDMTVVDTEYFHEQLHEVPKQASDLDGEYESSLTDRSVVDLDPISLALLRLANYELKHRLDVPYKVVINEAVSLAKKFGPVDSYKFINGVLDKMVLNLRELEVKADKKQESKQESKQKDKK